MIQWFWTCSIEFVWSCGVIHVLPHFVGKKLSRNDASVPFAMSIEPEGSLEAGNRLVAPSLTSIVTGYWSQSSILNLSTKSSSIARLSSPKPYRQIIQLCNSSFSERLKSPNIFQSAVRGLRNELIQLIVYLFSTAVSAQRSILT